SDIFPWHQHRRRDQEGQEISYHLQQRRRTGRGGNGDLRSGCRRGRETRAERGGWPGAAVPGVRACTWPGSAFPTTHTPGARCARRAQSDGYAETAPCARTTLEHKYMFIYCAPTRRRRVAI